MRDIQKLVRSLGIGGNYQGYRYLLYALSLCLQNEDYLLSVSKLLYPEIAHTYQTSASSVERNLRTVVSVCWERGNRPLLESISLCPLSSKPTIGEFLDILTEYLRVELNLPLPDGRIGAKLLHILVSSAVLVIYGNFVF